MILMNKMQEREFLLALLLLLCRTSHSFYRPKLEYVPHYDNVKEDKWSFALKQLQEEAGMH